MLNSAMSVLRLFGPGRSAISMAEVSRLLERPPTTVSRWLRSMATAGFLERDSETARYSIATALIRLAALTDQSEITRRVGRAALLRLTIDTRETSALGVLQGREAVLIDVTTSPHAIRFATTVGERLPLHTTATGKCLLAWKPDALVRTLLPEKITAATKSSITSVSRLLEQLAEVRKRGFAFARSELEEGLDSVAAPIRDHSGEVVAALSVGGPNSRLRGQRLDAAGRHAVLHAEVASKQLGFKQRQS